MSGILWLTLVAGVSAAERPKAVMAADRTAPGEASVEPDSGISGEYGTWTVRFVVGAGGISRGGGIRVQLPDAFHAGDRNSANSLQATRPSEPHYISARSSNQAVKLHTEVEGETGRTLVKHAKESLDGRSERYVFVVRISVGEGELREGDTISVVYGDTSQGSPGMLAGAIAHDPEPVLIAVDPKGDGGFALIDLPPAIRSAPGKPVEVLCHLPSDSVVGQPTEALLAVLDKQANPVDRAGRFHVRVHSGSAEVPGRVSIPAGRGFVRFPVIPRKASVLRLEVRDPDSGFGAVSNPSDVQASRPATRLYWGDLHSHTKYSWDGVGNDAFNYARNVAGLDFYSMSDHTLWPRGAGTRGLGAHNWGEYIALPDKFNEPGAFVTMHAYECSFGRPYGHHIVYFRDRPTVLMYPSQHTLEEMWRALAEGEAVTIPHHTGKFPGGVDFAYHDPKFRRNFEIYSGHGLSEVYNPGHLLSFEHSKFTSDARSLKSPTFAQDTWIRGLKLSTIASSDDHRGQPGKPHYGIVGLRAPALTRDGVFQALHDRHTYGTTGSKIILEFSVNGTSMGRVAGVTKRAVIRVKAIGTGEIEAVEVLRHAGDSGEFEVLWTVRPEGWEYEGTFEDDAAPTGAVYYARVLQEEPVWGLPAMAWSSPVWMGEPGNGEGN